MNMKSVYVACIIFVLCGVCNAHDTLTYPSPDHRWTIIATWINDNYSYDFVLKDNKTGKTFFGLDGQKPADNEMGCKNVEVIWSPDSRFAAINVSIGRITSDICLITTDGKEPSDMGSGWLNTPKETFEVSLLKEKDKKRFEGWQHLWITAKKWINNSELEIDADMGAWLKATEKTPRERLDVSAVLTVRIDKTGNGHILRGKYEAYDKTPVKE